MNRSKLRRRSRLPLLRRKGFASHWAIVASLFLFLLITLPASAQLPTPTPSALRSLLPTLGTDTPEVVTGDVHLDGRRLFSIAAPAVTKKPEQPTQTTPIDDRVETIEATLNRVANSTLKPGEVDVTFTLDPSSNLPVISVEDRYLMTVTTLDAQLQGQNPERRAEELVETIKAALVAARQERQSDYLTNRAMQASVILLAILGLSWILSRIQDRLSHQRQRLNVEFPPPSEEDSPNTTSSSDTAAIAAVQENIIRRQQLTVNTVKRRLLQLLQIILWVGGSFLLLGLFPYTRWLQPLLLTAPLKGVGILLASYVAIQISNVLIDRFFSALMAQEFSSPGTSQRLALRISTFSRVLRSGVAFLIFGAALLTILSMLGVQLGPVLAGAGILGLAISFASQNLIKDVINGFFILLEDQYAVGDVVQIGQVSGLVESLNLRITQLRNAEGRLITIPNSAISIVENLSKDWSRVDLAITIAYDADLNRAISVIQEVGLQMDSDPNWKDRICDPPQVLGVDDIGNMGITIRIWIKTQPLEQWNVAREFRRRLKYALDKEGVAIGVPQQALFFQGQPELNNRPLDKDGNRNRPLENLTE